MVAMPAERPSFSDTAIRFAATFLDSVAMPAERPGFSDVGARIYAYIAGDFWINGTVRASNSCSSSVHA
jgi:hypothetical protein